MRVLAVASLCLCAVLVSAAPALAAETFYVGPEVPAGNPCTEEEPCKLGEAVGKAEDGDSVVVADGEYIPPVGGLLIEDEIDVGAAPGARPLISTTNTDDVQLAPKSNATIHDLTIVGTGPLQMKSGTAERMYISYHGVEPVDGEPGAACLIVLDEQSTPVTLRDSVCWSNDLIGPSNGDALRVSAGFEGDEKLVTLRNVTAVAEGEAGDGIEAFSAASAKLTVDAKNVIAQSATEIDVRAAVDDESNFSITRINLAGSNYSSRVSGGNDRVVTAEGTAGNQTAEPEFVNAPEGDFHETSASPTLDAGVEDPLNGLTDLDGIGRSQVKCLGGTAPPLPDAGAYERIATDQCPPPPPVPVPPPEPPKPRFRILKLKVNKKTGGGSVQIEVPSAGIASVTGSGIKFVTRTTTDSGVVTLPIQPWAITLVRLKKQGKTKIRLKIKFEARSGGPTKLRTRKVLLKRGK